jgi:hypothetical protein
MESDGFPPSSARAHCGVESDSASAEPKPLWDAWPASVETKPLSLGGMESDGFPPSSARAHCGVESDSASAEPKPLWDAWPASVETKPLWDPSSAIAKPKPLCDPWPPTSNHIVVFFNTKIKTMITCDPLVVEQFIQDIRGDPPPHRLIVGLDTEWRIIGGSDYYQVALLQLCVGQRCLVF